MYQQPTHLRAVAGKNLHSLEKNQSFFFSFIERSISQTNLWHAELCETDKTPAYAVLAKFHFTYTFLFHIPKYNSPFPVNSRKN